MPTAANATTFELKGVQTLVVDVRGLQGRDREDAAALLRSWDGLSVALLGNGDPRLENGASAGEIVNWPVATDGVRAALGRLFADEDVRATSASAVMVTKREDALDAARTAGVALVIGIGNESADPEMRGHGPAGPDLAVEGFGNVYQTPAVDLRTERGIDIRRAVKAALVASGRRTANVWSGRWVAGARARQTKPLTQVEGIDWRFASEGAALLLQSLRNVKSGRGRDANNTSRDLPDDPVLANLYADHERCVDVFRGLRDVGENADEAVRNMRSLEKLLMQAVANPGAILANPRFAEAADLPGEQPTLGAIGDFLRTSAAIGQTNPEAAVSAFRSVASKAIGSTDAALGAELHG